jgi:hypothetical protein
VGRSTMDREVQRLTFFNLQKMHCPCSKCQGHRKLLVRTVREHLILNGRDPNFRVWMGPGARNSSDEEWEGHMCTRNQRLLVKLDSHVDTRGMVDNAFLEEPLPPDVEEIVHEVVTGAFDLGDTVHKECNDSSGEGDVVNLSEHGVTSCKDVEGHETSDHFDPTMLEEAIQEFYEGSRSTKLAATILLMNLCTIHGVSNNFADELFTILHHHLLPEGNRLPKNHYMAKSLTSKLGLTYTSIHACGKDCVLFRGEYADAERCPKCEGPRFSDGDRKKYLVKVLRHFPIIPRLQRMFRSPSISALMKWHAENQSDREGGDGLVRHPCNSKAWKHFHENVDPTFQHDARNVHFVLAVDGVNPFKQTRSTWSTWPIVLLKYNLPPWLSTKKFFLMLCLLILDKQSVTSECFDVYMEPLVEELLEL